jgi:phosphoribosylformylglycinamidine synthase
VNKDKIIIPIAHSDGNYICDEETLKEMEDSSRVVFRYEDCPNGALNSIAGIVNKGGNILGMMPHPERASEDIVGSHDGKYIFESIIRSLN